MENQPGKKMKHEMELSSIVVYRVHIPQVAVPACFLGLGPSIYIRVYTHIKVYAFVCVFIFLFRSFMCIKICSFRTPTPDP